MTKEWGVWCRVSGGVTGTREAWLKDSSGDEKRFTQSEAEAEAERLMAGVSANPNNARYGATFSYRAERRGW